MLGVIALASVRILGHYALKVNPRITDECHQQTVINFISVWIYDRRGYVRSGISALI